MTPSSRRSDFAKAFPKIKISRKGRSTIDCVISWRPFENFKIETPRRKGAECVLCAFRASASLRLSVSILKFSKSLHEITQSIIDRPWHFCARS